VNLVTKPKPHQKSSKTPSSNESETSAETTTDTNSIDNSESDINYISFENSNKDLIGNCDSVNATLLSMDDQNMSSISESNRKIADISEENTLNLSVGQFKRVKLDSDQQNDSIPNKELKLLFVNSCENSAEFTDSQNEESDDLKDKSLNKKIMKSSDNLYNNQNCDPILGNEETIPLALSQIQAYDILICGNCRTLFTSLPLFIQHKRSSKCRLRFVCHCHRK
jgi:uncharacterized CHY-type Zn-finger protein